MNIKLLLLLVFSCLVTGQSSFINDFEWRMFESRNAHLNTKSSLIHKINLTKQGDVFSDDSTLFAINHQFKAVWIRKVLPFDSFLDDQLTYIVGRFVYILETGDNRFLNTFIEQHKITYDDLITKSKLNTLFKNKHPLKINSVESEFVNTDRYISITFSDPKIELKLKLNAYSAPTGDRYYQPYEDYSLESLLKETLSDSIETDSTINSGIELLYRFGKYASIPLVTDDTDSIINVFYSKKSNKVEITRSDISLLRMWRTQNQSIKRLFSGRDSVFIKLNTN